MTGEEIIVVILVGILLISAVTSTVIQLRKNGKVNLQDVLEEVSDSIIPIVLKGLKVLTIDPKLYNTVEDYRKALAFELLPEVRKFIQSTIPAFDSMLTDEVVIEFIANILSLYENEYINSLFNKTIEDQISEVDVVEDGKVDITEALEKATIEEE